MSQYIFTKYQNDAIIAIGLIYFARWLVPYVERRLRHVRDISEVVTPPKKPGKIGEEVERSIPINALAVLAQHQDRLLRDKARDLLLRRFALDFDSSRDGLKFILSNDSNDRKQAARTLIMVLWLVQEDRYQEVVPKFLNEEFVTSLFDFLAREGPNSLQADTRSAESAMIVEILETIAADHEEKLGPLLPVSGFISKWLALAKGHQDLELMIFSCVCLNKLKDPRDSWLRALLLAMPDHSGIYNLLIEQGLVNRTNTIWVTDEPPPSDRQRLHRNAVVIADAGTSVTEDNIHFAGTEYV